MCVFEVCMCLMKIWGLKVLHEWYFVMYYKGNIWISLFSIINDHDVKPKYLTNNITGGKVSGDLWSKIWPKQEIEMDFLPFFLAFIGSVETVLSYSVLLWLAQTVPLNDCITSAAFSSLYIYRYVFFLFNRIKFVLTPCTDDFISSTRNNFCVMAGFLQITFSLIVFNCIKNMFTPCTDDFINMTIKMVQ